MEDDWAFPERFLTPTPSLLKKMWISRRVENGNLDSKWKGRHEIRLDILQRVTLKYQMKLRSANILLK